MSQFTWWAYDKARCAIFFKKFFLDVFIFVLSSLHLLDSENHHLFGLACSRADAGSAGTGKARLPRWAKWRAAGGETRINHVRTVYVGPGHCM